MDTASLEGYLRLFHSQHLSLTRFVALLQAFDCIDALLFASEATLRATGLAEAAATALVKARSDTSVDGTIEADLHWARGDNHRLLLFESPDYPSQLKHISLPPPVLFVEGNVEVLSTAQVAIVGSRRASNNGRMHAHWLAKELSEAGLTISSGLALGIDTAAHRGALAAKGSSLAVLGAGIDHIYPRSNVALAQELVNGGALVSEFPLHTEPMAANFPRRNRIISGLSLGTVVVEATIKSGSLITAKYALEQNREVFAVPGPVNSQGARGCHQLLKQGAKLVESPSDVLEELGMDHSSSQRLSSGEGDHRTQPHPGSEVLAAMDVDGSLLDSLQSSTGLGYGPLIKCLLQLELDGKIEVVGGRYKPVSRTLA